MRLKTNYGTTIKPHIIVNTQFNEKHTQSVTCGRRKYVTFCIHIQKFLNRGRNTMVFYVIFTSHSHDYIIIKSKQNIHGDITVNKVLTLTEDTLVIKIIIK